MKINELCKEIHKNAVEHGWWEEGRSFGEIIALCHSELSEALEEYRTNIDSQTIYSRDDTGRMFTYKYYLAHVTNPKPEGIPIELADCIIRVLDYCGYAGIDIESAMENQLPSKYYGDFTEFITVCHFCLSRAYYQHQCFGDGVQWLAIILKTIQQYCKAENIDLKEAIRIKMEYNKTRPYKHGGKKC